MNIAIIGAGYVGLPSAAIFSDFGNLVWVVRRNKDAAAQINAGKSPIYEPGLQEIIERNVKAGRLIATTNYAQAVPQADVVFIAVGTPSKESGEVDVSQVLEAAKEVAKHLKSGYTVVADKSTVPIGTAEKVYAVIQKNKSDDADFDVASCPEFLRQGSAVKDTQEPDRIVVGSDSERAIDVLKKAHHSFNAPVVVTSTKSAEMVKYAANSYLALRIGFIDQIALLCEKTGADVMDVIMGIGYDKRIGAHYWYPGLGYGGSCFPKDVKGLASIFRSHGLADNLFEALSRLNRERTKQIALRLDKALEGIKGKTIAVLGLSCKPETDDMRESQPEKLIGYLLEMGAKVFAYDPVSMENAKKKMPTITYKKTAYDAINGTNAAVIATEWNEFRQLDLKRVAKSMTGDVFYDAKNVYEPEVVARFGLRYFGTGR